MTKQLKSWKLNSIIKSASVSTINQFVTSGTNFILGLFLIRTLSVTEFGTYGILLALALVLAGFGNAVFLGQMVVHYPDEKESERHAYVSSIFQLITASNATLLLVVSLTYLVFTNILNMDLSYWSESFCVLVFSFGYLSKEFFCRLSYTQRQEIRAVRINLTISFVMAVLLLTIVYSDLDITASRVLFCYAISTFIGTFLGFFEAKLYLKPESGRLKSSLKQVWIGGRWALFSDFLYAVRQQAHIFVTAAIVGTVGVGMINAAKLFLMPVMLLTPSLSQIFIVRLVTLRHSAPLKLIKRGVLFSLVSILSVVIYGIVLFILYEYIHKLIITDAFTGINGFVVAWFFVALCSAARYGLETTQKAMKRFKSLAIINVPISIFALIAVYTLLSLLGAEGAIFGLAIAELLLAIVLSRLVYKTAVDIRNSTSDKV